MTKYRISYLRTSSSCLYHINKMQFNRKMISIRMKNKRLKVRGRLMRYFRHRLIKMKVNKISIKDNRNFIALRIKLLILHLIMKTKMVKLEIEYLIMKEISIKMCRLIQINSNIWTQIEFKIKKLTCNMKLKLTDSKFSRMLVLVIKRKSQYNGWWETKGH